MQKHYYFGLHTVQSLLLKHPENVRTLFVQTSRQDIKIEDILKQAEDHGIPIELKTKQELDRMTEDAHHQGVVVFYTQKQRWSENDLPTLIEKTTSPPFILILDGVQDPHNLGACFRSADAAGVDFILAPKDKAVGVTPVVSRVASGAAETVPFIQVTNLVRVMEELKQVGIWIYGAAAESEQNLFSSQLKGPTAIVLGAEGKGLRRLTKEHCDVLLSIPLLGSVSSLNVSVATGIFLFEVVRQRMSI